MVERYGDMQTGGLRRSRHSSWSMHGMGCLRQGVGGRDGRRKWAALRRLGCVMVLQVEWLGWLVVLID